MSRTVSERWSAVDVVLLALALGVGAGLLQALVYSVLRVVFHEFTWMPREVVWMSPLANAWWIGWIGVVLAALHALLPRIATIRRVLFGLFAVSALSLTLLATRVHPIALIVLALGIGSWLSGIAAGRLQAVRSGLRPGLLGVTTVVLLCGATSRGWRVLQERRALAAVPPAAASSPNVLLLILDTVRAQNLSLYGYERPTTPVLDSLSASSAVFDAAFSPSSWTLPTHASLFTGMQPFETKTDWREPLDRTFPVIAEHFQAAGYTTGGFVANLAYGQVESGLARGFHHYVDHRISIRQILLASSLVQVPVVNNVLTARSWTALRDALVRFKLRRDLFSFVQRKPAGLVVDEFLAWESGRDRPFFAFLNFFDAHEPYGAPGPWRSAPSGRATTIDRYDGGIWRIDARIGEMLDSLRRRGVLDRTIIVVTSDHGEQFDEHGLIGHGNSLYAQAIRVPLLIRSPDGLGAGARIAQAVTLQDIGATMLELANLAAGFPGRSLVPALRGQLMNGSPVIQEFGGLLQFDPSLAEDAFLPMRGIVHGDWHFIQRDDGKEELFNVRRDPEETLNVAGDASFAATSDTLRALLNGSR